MFEEKLEKASNGISRLEFITIENRWLDTIIGFTHYYNWGLDFNEKMSGGGAGGPGGQIFSIGKSKAKLAIKTQMLK